MIEIPDDEQLVFDTVAKHLLDQGEKSLGFEGECLYRNEQGLKCAAGCLIPDKQYYASLEGIIWSGLILHGRVSKHCESLISHLQLIHDNNNPDTWLSVLHRTAKVRNLNTSKLPPLEKE